MQKGFIMRKITLCLVLLFFAAANCNAETQENLGLKLGREHILATLKEFAATRVDFQLYEPESNEFGEIFRADVSFYLSGGKILPLLISKLENTEDDFSQISLQGVFCINSQEISFPDRKTLLDTRLQIYIVTGNPDKLAAYDSSMIKTAFENLDFEPGIMRNGDLPEIRAWINELRLDFAGNFYLQLIAKDYTGFSSMAKKMVDAHPDQQVRISSCKNHKYLKQKTILAEIRANSSPVKLSNDFNLLFDHIYSVITPYAAIIDEIRVEPSNMRNSFELPMKIEISEIPVGQVEEVKNAILNLDFAGMKIRAGDEIETSEATLKMDFYVADRSQ